MRSPRSATSPRCAPRGRTRGRSRRRTRRCRRCRAAAAGGRGQVEQGSGFGHRNRISRWAVRRRAPRSAQEGLRAGPVADDVDGMLLERVARGMQEARAARASGTSRPTSARWCRAAWSRPRACRPGPRAQRPARRRAGRGPTRSRWCRGSSGRRSRSRVPPPQTMPAAVRCERSLPPAAGGYHPPIGARPPEAAESRGIGGQRTAGRPEAPGVRRGRQRAARRGPAVDQLDRVLVPEAAVEADPAEVVAEPDQALRDARARARRR